jgi:large subunit ribosomal protein L23
MKDLYKIIRKPVVSEKAAVQKDKQNKYYFCVSPDANKIDVQRAVEQIYQVKVIDVNTSRIRGKKKRMGVYEGTRPLRKRAIVTLKSGDTIKSVTG